MYTVSEADCVVSITVVKTGSAAIPVVISFNTENDTALGKPLTAMIHSSPVVIAEYLVWSDFNYCEAYI